MKKMLLTATAVGTALAGSILYLRRKRAAPGKAALDSSTASLPDAPRSQHAMG
ncbi:MAG: hypothetical protein JWP27_1677 [Flaviaesturariibacter sp.]|nr:hypothetical protein [Flaviaesturariibacter sp.]